MAIIGDESTVDKTQTSELLSVDEINRWKEAAARETREKILDDERDRIVDQADATMSTIVGGILIGPIILYFFLFHLLVVQPMLH